MLYSARNIAYNSAVLMMLYDLEKKREKMSDDAQQENQKKEYAVFNPEGKGDFSQHATLDDAKREAERLSAKRPNVKITVFESVGYIKSELKTSQFNPIE